MAAVAAAATVAAMAAAAEAAAVVAAADAARKSGDFSEANAWEAV